MKAKLRLNVILGKSPGAALRRFGHRAYSIEAQKDDCKHCFNRKFGKQNWKVLQWYILLECFNLNLASRLVLLE